MQKSLRAGCIGGCLIVALFLSVLQPLQPSVSLNESLRFAGGGVVDVLAPYAEGLLKHYIVVVESLEEGREDVLGLFEGVPECLYLVGMLKFV